MVNGNLIFPLPDSKPVVIPLEENNSRIVITDGYHITRPMKIFYKDADISCFKVCCALNDWHLGIGALALIAFYLTGYTTGLLIFKIFSFLPVIYLLLFYYLNRKDFLKMIPVVKTGTA